ncbi:MAG: non-hydrolyzing UDP-N-acetylglucosamine 2-epimerase [Planctomycetota bacterium]|jgi:UDP-N-acetylglucosamine 2-epimerase (non-hydrolysing)
MSSRFTIVLGTRPEVIKLAPIEHALRKAGASVRVVATGQHSELLDTALHDMDLKVDVNLAVMTENQSLSSLTASLIEALDTEFTKHPPETVLVQGDTTSTFVGALTAFYHGARCAHVEAGLRSGDLKSPWPEEMNRRLTSQIAYRHYAPTEGAKDALLREGVDASSIVVTGQTGVDAAIWMLEKVGDKPTPELVPHIENHAGPLIFATGHRRENQNGGIVNVVTALTRALTTHQNALAVYAAHPSPNVREQIASASDHERLKVIGPVSYPSSIYLMSRADVIVTDSGGIQEEAPSFGTPVLVTRENTERPEGLAAGFLQVVGTDTDAIEEALSRVLNNSALKSDLKLKPNPYGDGKAARRIADDLVGA